MQNQQNHTAQTTPRESVRFLLFSASLRNGSLNTKLAQLAKSVIEKNGGQADLA